jgi:DNA-binding transcriptional LysR family regulator
MMTSEITPLEPNTASRSLLRSSRSCIKPRIITRGDASGIAPGSARFPAGYKRSGAAFLGKFSLKQFAEAEHVALFYKTQGPGVVDTLLAQKGYARKIAVQSPHFASLPFLVANSHLIATVPERIARQDARQLRLQVLPVPLDVPAFRLTLLWHQRHHSDPAHQWLRQAFVNTATHRNSH